MSPSSPSTEEFSPRFDIILWIEFFCLLQIPQFFEHSLLYGCMGHFVPWILGCWEQILFILVSVSFGFKETVNVKKYHPLRFRSINAKWTSGLSAWRASSAPESSLRNLKYAILFWICKVGQWNCWRVSSRSLLLVRLLRRKRLRRFLHAGDHWVVKF